MHPRLETFQGRLVDGEGQAVSGLRVRAIQPRPLGSDIILGETSSGSDGRFRIEAARRLFETLTSGTRVHLEVLDPRGARVIARTGRLDADDRQFQVGDFVIPAADITGWAATLGTGRAQRVSAGNDARLLIDGTDSFARMREVLLRARSHVEVAQLLLRPDYAPFDGSEETFAEVLRGLARRGVEMRILLNDNAAAPDDVSTLRNALRDEPRIRVRGLPIAPGVQHAKAILVDGDTAFIVGPPFQRRFWDQTAHPVENEKRGNHPPMHDVVLEVRGPAVRDIAQLFVELWNVQGREEDDADWLRNRVSPGVAGGSHVQVLRTMPDGLRTGPGETGCVEAHGRAHAAVKDFLYLENQYFTAASFIRSFDAMLAAAPGVECIVLLNDATDVPNYNPLQAEYVESLSRHPNVGFFSSWSSGERNGQRGVAPIYIHSKVSIADDAWGMVGSANVDGLSLDSATELALPGARSIELNVAILDGADDSPRTGTVATLRAHLWAHHLGVPAEHLERAPPGGWLALWRRIAHENIERVRAGDFAIQGHVLPLYGSFPHRYRLD